MEVRDAVSLSVPENRGAINGQQLGQFGRGQSMIHVRDFIRQR